MFYAQGKGWIVDVNWSILPRNDGYLIGIVTSPLIHGDFQHLISNISVLFPLLILLHYTTKKHGHLILVTMWFLTGFLVWLFARPSYHMGASGVVYAIQTYLLFSGIVKRRIWLMAVGAISIMLFGGGFLFGLLPFQPGVSFESHGLGAATGVLIAFLFKNKGIKPKPKKSKKPKGDNYLRFGL